MLKVENSSNGITVERNEGVIKISGDFKVPFNELPKEKQKDILKLILEKEKQKKIES